MNSKVTDRTNAIIKYFLIPLEFFIGLIKIDIKNTIRYINIITP